MTTIKEIFEMQENITSLQLLIKKQKEALDQALLEYPRNENQSYIQDGFHLYYLPHTVRKVLVEKLKQEKPEIYNTVVKVSITASDVEQALGALAEQYFTTKTTYNAKIIKEPNLVLEKTE